MPHVQHSHPPPLQPHLKDRVGALPCRRQGLHDEGRGRLIAHRTAHDLRDEARVLLKGDSRRAAAGGAREPAGGPCVDLAIAGQMDVARENRHADVLGLCVVLRGRCYSGCGLWRQKIQASPIRGMALVGGLKDLQVLHPKPLGDNSQQSA